MTLGGAYPSTFQHFAGDAYYIAHNSTRIGFNTFLVEKTIVCFQFKGFLTARFYSFLALSGTRKRSAFFFSPNLSPSSRMGRSFGTSCATDPGRQSFIPLTGKQLGDLPHQPALGLAHGVSPPGQHDLDLVAIFGTITLSLPALMSSSIQRCGMVPMPSPASRASRFSPWC